MFDDQMLCIKSYDFFTQVNGTVILDILKKKNITSMYYEAQYLDLGSG